MKYWVYIVVWGCLHTQAQSVLEGYVQLGLKNNQNLITQNLHVRQSVESVKEAKGKLQPSVFLDASYTWADGGRTIDIPAGDLLNPVYGAINGILGNNAFPVNVQNVSEQLLPNDFHETKIRLIQPLFNPQILYNYRAKQSLAELERLKHKEMERKLGKEIKTAYIKLLLLHRKKEILLNSRKLLENVLRVNIKLVQNHKETKDVVSASKLELSKLDTGLKTLNKEIHHASTFFNYLINVDLYEEVILDTSEVKPALKAFELQKVGVGSLDGRFEIASIDLQKEINRLQGKAFRSAYLPKVNVIADLGYQGFHYNFDRDQQFWLVNLNLKWSLFEGHQNKAKIAQAKTHGAILESQRMEAGKKLQVLVNRAYYDYTEAWQLTEKAIAESNYANEIYTMAEIKHRENLMTFLELKDAFTQDLNAQLQVAIAYHNLKIHEIEYEYAATGSMDWNREL